MNDDIIQKKTEIEATIKVALEEQNKYTKEKIDKYVINF